MHVSRCGPWQQGWAGRTVRWAGAHRYGGRSSGVRRVASLCSTTCVERIVRPSQLNSTASMYDASSEAPTEVDSASRTSSPLSVAVPSGPPSHAPLLRHASLAHASPSQREYGRLVRLPASARQPRLLLSRLGTACLLLRAGWARWWRVRTAGRPGRPLVASRGMWAAASCAERLAVGGGARRRDAETEFRVALHCMKFHCYMPKTTTWQEAKPLTLDEVRQRLCKSSLRCFDTLFINAHEHT